MLNTPQITHVKSVCHAKVKPTLSVLIPYFRDNPAPLLKALTHEISDGGNVEILMYDDGTGDAPLNTRLCANVKQADSAVHLMIAAENRGRAFARNSLTQHARADWVLFLDADMRPVTEHFVSDYMALIDAEAADIIFGGFKVPAKAETPEQELHRAFSETSDCLSLTARQAKGPQYVCSSNLCVRKTVLDSEPFDPGFSGWGWEDSEWAARTANRFNLVHADIPALHLGLESTDTLLRRFKDSGANYERFTQKHPELAKTLALYAATRKLSRVPGQKLARPLLKSLVKGRFIPVKLRLIALKLWRASWYAEAIS